MENVNKDIVNNKLEPVFKSVFILLPIDYNWIVEKLMRDISNELAKRDVIVNVGNLDFYNGEEIVLHARFLETTKIDTAKINTLWVTHFDDYFKRKKIVDLIKIFDSVINMSPDDDNLLRSFCEDKFYSIGIDLPIRNVSMRLLNFVIFSSSYPDGRKNEQWIVDYVRNLDDEKKKLVRFTFLGWGWSRIAELFEKYSVNYQIISYTRNTQDEYNLYKQDLAHNNVLLYMGFDGGSMSFYDGIAAGLQLVMPKLSYHIGANNFVDYFENKDEFFKILDAKVNLHFDKSLFLDSRSISSYCDKLIIHWNCLMLKRDGENLHLVDLPICRDIYAQTYKPINFARLRSAVIRTIRFLLK